MKRNFLKLILPISLAFLVVVSIAGSVSYAKYIKEAKVGMIDLAISGVTVKQCVLNDSVAQSTLSANRATVTTVIFDRWTGQPDAVRENGFEWSEGTESGMVADTIRSFISTDGTTVYFLTKGSAEMTVNDCDYIFCFYGNLFEHIELNNFNTSSVTDMSQMFSGCGELKSIIFGDNFSTKNVTDMTEMFNNCSELQSLDLSLFETSKVTNMYKMFNQCNVLQSADFSCLETGEVTNMAEMFFNCDALQTIDVSGFDTANVTDMSSMFASCSSVVTLDLRSFDTTNVTNMKSMFAHRPSGTGYIAENCETALTTLRISDKFDTSNVTNMSYMFDGLIHVTDFSFLQYFDTSNVTSMSHMFTFVGADTLDLSSFNTAAVRSMSSMFREAGSATAITFGTGFDTSQVLSMDYMFDGCISLLSLDVSRFNTAKVTTMAGMFDSCKSLTSLDLTSFDTSSVKSMYSMFASCTNLASVNLSSFDTTNVTNYGSMFSQAKALTKLDLQSFDIFNGTQFNYMFHLCSSLTTITVTPYNSSTQKGWYHAGSSNETFNTYTNIFNSCLKLVGGNGTKYDQSNTNAWGYSYFRIDGTSTSTKGYLSHTPHEDTDKNCKCDACGRTMHINEDGNCVCDNGCGTELNSSGHSYNSNDVCKYCGKSKPSCFASGTLITLADGSQKKIEDLLQTDLLRAFDHETGQYISVPIMFIEYDGIAEYQLINLKFSNGVTSRIIYEHAFFDLTLNEYVYVTAQNYASLIGHEFAVGQESGFARVTLEDAYLSTEETGCYSLATVYHLNHFIDGMFSMPGGCSGLFNYFEYDPETLAYDEEKMQADIEKYGLYTYQDFEDLLTPEVFYEVYPVKYLKVSVAKGMITQEDFVYIVERYLKQHGIMPS